MTVTVREALELEVFRRAEPTVMAGASALDRRIRWVHVAEVADIAYLLRGDELLLTTGLGIGDGEEAQRRYVRDLANVGVAGVVLELGRTFADPPPTMVDEAERCGLPFVVLGRECRYVDVTEQVHAAIINRQFELLQRAESIGREFVDLVLKGEGLPRIVRRLAQEVGSPVVLEDAAHQVVELDPRRWSIEAILREWQAHSRTGHTDEGFVARHEPGEPGCAWITIAFRDEAWGRLHVLRVDRALDEVASLALGQAAAAIAVALFADRDAAHVVDRARGALLADIRRGHYESESEVVERARALGSDFQDLLLAAIVVEVPGLPELVAERRFSERERQRLRMRLLAHVRAAVDAESCTSLSSIEGDDIGAIVGIPSSREPAEALRAVAEQVARAVEGDFSGLRAVTGAALAPTPVGLRSAFENAAHSARYGAQMATSDPFYYHDEVGLNHLLLRLADGPDLARFVEAELAELLRHDATASQRLVPTLRSYLEHGGQKAAAARALHVERRTLYYRLERIGRVLGRDLEDRDVQVRLLIALRGLSLLEGRFRRTAGGGGTMVVHPSPARDRDVSGTPPVRVADPA